MSKGVENLIEKPESSVFLIKDGKIFEKRGYSQLFQESAD
jgi:hypothetical protein